MTANALKLATVRGKTSSLALLRNNRCCEMGILSALNFASSYAQSA
jgi:hypothetical protein